MIKKDYNADSITTLEGLEHIRRKPGMYLPAELPTRLLHLLWEVLDNSIDEMTSQFAKQILITLHKDGSASVQDDGRGLPHEKIVDSFTKTNTSGKFNDGAYEVSVGTHGIGLKAVNAFSDKIVVEVSQNGKKYLTEFEHYGEVKTPTKEIGKSKTNGTYVRFWPDKKTFEGLTFDRKEIFSRLFKLQFLIKTFNVSLFDEATNKTDVFKYENGLLDFIKHLTKNHKVFNPTPFVAHSQSPEMSADVIIQWTDADSETFEAFANYVTTPEGGTHINGVRYAIPEIINKLARDWKLLKDRDENLDPKDIRDGMVIIVSCKISQKLLAFAGQTKAKLSTPDALKFVSDAIRENFIIYAKQNKKELTDVINRIIINRNARIDAKKASDAIKKIKSDPKKEKILSGKLAKCSSKNYKECELFICEGDSAAGGLKNGRDKEIQAVLPLRGKVINSFKKSLHDIMLNEELATIIHCVNGGIGKEFKVEDAHYGKIIITTDADEDGNHITCLLITFFWKYMRPLLQNGMIYLSLTPLFKIRHKKTNEYKYAFTNIEYEEMKKKLKMNEYEINRFKGLGELNQEQLVDTALSPNTRKLIQVKIENATEAEKFLEILIGDDAKIRKDWIVENVNFVDDET